MRVAPLHRCAAATRALVRARAIQYGAQAVAPNSFDTLGLRSELVDALEALDTPVYEPNEMQSKALPIGLSGDDLLVCAQTGSGKTLMFLLPILQRIGPSQRAIVAVPTPELAAQVARVAASLAARLPDPPRVELVTSPEDEPDGTGAEAAACDEGQRRHSSMRAAVLVGEAGELCRRAEVGSLALAGLAHLAFDEADALLCERGGRNVAVGLPLLDAVRRQVRSGHVAATWRLPGGRAAVTPRR